jgi:putative tryptophan/tyrosine transport system substrate-binding protein
VIDRRRFLLTSVAGALAAPLSAHAQPGAKMRRIGYLGSTPLTGPEMAPIWTAFVEALRERGWFEGQNIVFERRYADGRVERLDDLAVELSRLRPDAIVAASHPAALAARKATSETPIVMAGVGDALRYGLVASLAHPGGRVTGVTLITQNVAAKGLELLKELRSRSARVGFLWNAALPFSEVIWSEARTAGEQLGLTLHPLEVRRPDEFELAFAAGVRERIEALFVRADPLTLTNREQVVKLAAQHRLIAMYSASEFVLAGGLISYSAPLRAAFRDAARYVDKILRGAKPADLPVEQPTKFELIINLKTAKALGLTIPPSLLARADQTIE